MASTFAACTAPNVDHHGELGTEMIGVRSTAAVHGKASAVARWGVGVNVGVIQCNLVGWLSLRHQVDGRNRQEQQGKE